MENQLMDRTSQRSGAATPPVAAAAAYAPRSDVPAQPASNDPTVTCGLCFGFLQEPATLDCNHSFCSRCLRVKLETARAQGSTDGSAEPFLCPLCCMEHTNLTTHSLSDYADGALAQKVMALLDPSRATVDGRPPRPPARKCAVRGHEEYPVDFFCVQCDEPCCAFCLQVGPHKGHESTLMAAAAAQMRQHISHDGEALMRLKSSVESKAAELGSTLQHYNESYDRLTAALTERFNQFRQQIMQKEIDLRRQLLALRDGGDRKLAASRMGIVRNLNTINVAVMKLRYVSKSGSDYEVMTNKDLARNVALSDLPTFRGEGFRLADVPALNLSDFSLTLDLNDESAAYRSSQPPARESTSRPKGDARGANTSATVSMQRFTPVVLTFERDPDMELKDSHDGIFMRCSDHASIPQVGVRSNEVFDTLQQRHGSVLAWRVRLDLVYDSFVGVVEGNTQPGHIPDGFYWRPMRQGQFDGKVGRPTAVLRGLPVCHHGDTLTLTYDANTKSLKLAINNVERGIILTDLHGQLCPCFVFRPGEALTLLK